MAKESVIARERKKVAVVERYKERKKAIMDVIKNPNATVQDRFQAQLALQRLPRNSAKRRLRSRCIITGRGNGVYSHFGLSKVKLREQIMIGALPGVKKASW